jgi:hypothetical protein
VHRLREVEDRLSPPPPAQAGEIDPVSDPSKVGTIEYDEKGNVTIYAPVAQVRPVAVPPPTGASQVPAEETPSQMLVPIIRHVNGLAVVLEKLRLKLEAREKSQR